MKQNVFVIGKLCEENLVGSRITALTIARQIKPGSVLSLDREYKHFLLFSESFWFHFFKEFIKINGKRAIQTLQFINVSGRVKDLINIAIDRNVNNTPHKMPDPRKVQDITKMFREPKGLEEINKLLEERLHDDVSPGGK